MKGSDVIKSQLFISAWREVKGQGHLAGEMVAWCFANRVRRGMGNWAEVLANIDRYRAHDIPKSEEFPNLWDAHAVKLMQAVDNVYDNLGKDLANGGMFYCFSEQEVRPWFKDAVLDNHDYKRTAAMNSLIIFG